MEMSEVLAVIGVILVMGSVGAEADTSIWLIIIQFLIGASLMTLKYIEILREEVENERW